MLKKKHSIAILIGIVALAALIYFFQNSFAGFKHQMNLAISQKLISILNYKVDQSPLAVNQLIIADQRLIAYSDKLVYQRGDLLTLYVKSDTPVDISLTMFSNDSEETIFTHELKPLRNTKDAVMSTFSGFDPRDFDAFNYRFRDSDVGWMQIKIASGLETRNVPLYVEGAKSSDVLFVESTDTMAAYVSANDLRTFYQPARTNLIGSFTRPDAYPMDYKLKLFHKSGVEEEEDCKDHLANADFTIKSALNNLKINFDTASDEYLDDYRNLTRYKLIVFGAHNEYWTADKIRNVEKFLQNGGSMLLLGGNTAYRLVKRVQGMTVFWGKEILKKNYKDFLSNYLGSYYDPRGLGTFAPFKVINEKSPLFRNRKNGEQFGSKSFIVNCDVAHGASGHETDKKITSHSGFTVVASGANAKGGGADVVFRKLDSGGYVLNFGSVNLWHGMSEPIIKDMIVNYYDLVRSSKRNALANLEKP